MSPRINDPTTAIHALGHISAVLCELAGRDLGPVLLTDDDGEVRVVLRRPGLAELVDVAINQPRRYGASDPQVMARLFQLLEELAWHVTTSDQRRTVEQLHQAHARVGAVLARATTGPPVIRRSVADIARNRSEPGQRRITVKTPSRVDAL